MCSFVHQLPRSLRIFMGICAIAIATSAQALIVTTAITPADGFITVGQEVGLTLSITNETNTAIPSIFSVRTNEIDGLSFPFEVPPCALVVAQISPPLSSISYSFSWRQLTDLAPMETRTCRMKFFVRTIPNGVIPISFLQTAGVILARTEFRRRPDPVQVPVFSSIGYLLMLSLIFLLSYRALKS